MLTLNHVTKYYGKIWPTTISVSRLTAARLPFFWGPTALENPPSSSALPGFSGSRVTSPSVAMETKTTEAKRLLAYIPETPAVYDMLTVSEHLEFIRRAYRIEDDGYGERLLERFELADKRDKLGRDLSKGMQQKLSICCGLVHRPKLIILTSPWWAWTPRHQGIKAAFPGAKRPKAPPSSSPPT